MNSNLIAELFWSKVKVTHRRRCWPWSAGTDDNGYGQIRIEGKTVRSPRVAFFLRNGRMPNHALHKCDNPICCNPDHIYDGDHQQNMRDMVERKRVKTVRGQDHYATTLTDQKVMKMKEKYKEGNISIPKIAVIFECSPNAAQRALSGTSFKHLL